MAVHFTSFSGALVLSYVFFKGHLLCISTSKPVLRTPFDGQNHFFGVKTSFSGLLLHKRKKRKESPKNNKKNMHKKGVYQCLGASLNGTKIKWVPKYILLNKHLLTVHLPVVTFLWKIEVSRFSFILSKMSYLSKEDIFVLLSTWSTRSLMEIHNSHFTCYNV